MTDQFEIPSRTSQNIDCTSHREPFVFGRMASTQFSARQLPIDLLDNGFPPIDRAWVLDKICSLEQLSFDTSADSYAGAIEAIFDRIQEAHVELRAFGFTLPPWLVNGKAISILHSTFPEFLQEHFAAQPEFLETDVAKCKSLDELKQYYLVLNHDKSVARQKRLKRRLKKLRRKAAANTRRLYGQEHMTGKRRDRLLSQFSRELQQSTGRGFGAEVWSMLAEAQSISDETRDQITRLLFEPTDEPADPDTGSDAESNLCQTWQTADGSSETTRMSAEASANISDNDERSEGHSESSQIPHNLSSSLFYQEEPGVPARQPYGFPPPMFQHGDITHPLGHERLTPLTYRTPSPDSRFYL